MSVITDKMHEYNLRAGDLLEVPILRAPDVHGTPGSTTYNYVATFVSNVGETTASPVSTTDLGPATLSSINFVRLNVDNVMSGVVRVNFYKEVAGAYKYIGQSSASAPVLDDVGQVPSSVIPPNLNTSGRPEWRALLWKPGKRLQRTELMDMQWILQRGVKDIGDSIFKNGDIIRGLAEQFVSSNHYAFTSGVVYLDGQYVDVPGGVVTLTGVGREMVGIVVTPRVVSSNDDAYLRNIDEGVAVDYCSEGADRLVYNIAWSVDTAGQIDIREFSNGAPLIQVFRSERTELQKEMERRTYDVSGNFSVNPFPMKMREHSSDADLMLCEVSGGGKAYVQGSEIATIAPQFPVVAKGRTVRSVNNSLCDPFDAPGGLTIGSATENFSVNGLAVKLKVDSGNYHTVTLSGTGQTAAQVATQINNSVNAYPTSGLTPLVACYAASGKLVIQAEAGKTLVIAAVASDAYTVLGISTGTYVPQGQRIYGIEHSFVKDTTDLSYITEKVVSITHDGTDHIDDMPDDGVQVLLGASTTLADAWDHKFDYRLNVDFVKNGNRADFSTLGGSKPNNGTVYYFRYRYNHNAVKGTRVRVRVTDAQITKDAEDGQDTIVFTGATSATEVKSGNTVAGLSGNASDVIRILRVNNSSGQSTSQYSEYALLKNSTALLHNTSQIDWSAAGAQGQAPLGQPSVGVTYYVTFEYWKHVVEGDYVSSASYLNDYEAVEKAPNGTWELRDCVDFRTVAGVLPIPADSPRFDYDYYLSRIDRLVLDKDATFSCVSGVPAESPVPPSEQAGPLSIALIRVPPYTYDPSACTIQSLEVQRKTQQGINEMQAQIERLQYLAAMNAVKDSATSHSAAADAQGIFAANFVGQKFGDYTFDKNGVKFTAAVDSTEQCVRLPVSEDGRILSVNDAASSGIARVGKVIMFDYDPQLYISQRKASGVINVNPYEAFGWIGTVSIDPEEDFWTDVTQIPDLDVNYDENMKAMADLAEDLTAENAERARKITWGAWRMTWDNSGGWAAGQLTSDTDYHWVTTTQDTTTIPGANAARERTGTYSSIVPERKLVDVGTRVVDVSVLPYMRTTYPNNDPFYITCLVKGMLPLTDVAASIDGVVVDLIEVAPSVAGIATYQGKTTVKTGASGSCTCKFQMPSGIRVGQKAVKIFSATNPDETYALSTFTSQGFRNTIQKSVMGIISTTERETTVTTSQFHYGDPLSQTFVVDEGPKWISAVNVYFQSKDTVLPVTLEVRGSTNGSPNRKVYQTCTLDPDQVSISEDASVPTTFTFENLVGYEAGEYSFVVVTNCITYNMWYAKLGQVDVPTGQLIRSQPYGGVMFTSPNDSYWQGHPDSDLTFEIWTANFENNAQVVFDDLTGVQANMLITAVTQVLPTGCSLDWAYSLDGGSSWVTFVPGIDTDLNAIATTVGLRVDVSGTGSTFQISESYAGIIMLLNDLTAEAIFPNVVFEDPANKVTFVVALDTDGVNGVGTRTVTPYYSVDDGAVWAELKTQVGHVPFSTSEAAFKDYQFETPSEKTITGATNATPIVVESSNHGFGDGMLVTVAGVGGNVAANGQHRVKNATAHTFELVHPTTGADIVGSNNYTTGGTINLTEFSQCRFRLHLETSNRAVTPRAKLIRGICG